MPAGTTDGFSVPKTEESKDKTKFSPSIFYTIFKVDVTIWIRLKNYWNVTFCRSDNIQANAFTSGLLFKSRFFPLFKIQFGIHLLGANNFSWKWREKIYFLFTLPSQDPLLKCFLPSFGKGHVDTF